LPGLSGGGLAATELGGNACPFFKAEHRLFRCLKIPGPLGTTAPLRT